MKIVEKRYRGSLICRIFGYPITYAIVKMLLEDGPMNLDEIVERVKIKKSGVCLHLNKLKVANVIRYEKRWPKTFYWIKYPKEIKDFLNVCERLVLRITQRLKKDY